jgi:hypothetical protein
LSFLNYDISASPREALHPFLIRSRPASAAQESVDESVKASAPEAESGLPEAGPPAGVKRNPPVKFRRRH